MYEIREAKPQEYTELGTLMVKVYSGLEGFPSSKEIPDYYNSLKNVGDFTQNPKTKLFVAVSESGKVEGGLVYFGDMRYYGAGGESTLGQRAGAFRLLAVNPETRGQGLGKKLIQVCFGQARQEGFEYLMIHSTKYMMTAWKLYERMGFEKFPEIDFEEAGVHVHGFRYKL
jgi:ribosomal protein S18 acetylase RimI-like enzyme